MSQDTDKNRTYINNFADYFIYQISTVSKSTIKSTNS